MIGLLQGLQDWAAELREIQKPLCIDLFCGLGGWTEGFLAEGYRVVGFDIEIRPYPAQLVIQDVLTIHGSQFKNAACIVASPPCQKYSYLAMPWSRSKSEHSQAAKALRREWETNGPDNRLFDACFRIQREAIEARRKMCTYCCGKGYWHTRPNIDMADIADCPNCNGIGSVTRFIPLIVENVRGAQPWVGRSAWNFDGSFHLWGDVPALMPVNLRRGQKVPGFRFDGRGRSFQTASVEHTKSDRESGGWFNDYKGEHCVGISRTGSKSNARKMASAQIAKIPFELARHVAQVYYPRTQRMARIGVFNGPKPINIETR